jgi:hypothetical protein
VGGVFLLGRQFQILLNRIPTEFADMGKNVPAAKGALWSGTYKQAFRK